MHVTKASRPHQPLADAPFTFRLFACSPRNRLLVFGQVQIAFCTFGATRARVDAEVFAEVLVALRLFVFVGRIKGSFDAITVVRIGIRGGGVFEELPYMPAKITIYRLPLVESFPDPAELEREIRITVLHELAHYFGIEEDRLDELGYG